MSIICLELFLFLCDICGESIPGGKRFPHLAPPTGQLKREQEHGCFRNQARAAEASLTRTDSIIALNNEVAMERHLNAIKALTMEADSLKRAVEEQKIAAKDDPEELNQWNSRVDTKIFAADESVKILKHNLEEFRQ